MPKGMQAIYTQRIGSSGASSISFNNIPQTYTDLKVLISVRGTANQWDSLGIIFNNNQSARSRNVTYGNGSSGFSNRGTYRDVGAYNGTNTTSDTYGSFEFYIPNYAQSICHQVIVDGGNENNATEAYQYLTAFVDLNSMPITKIAIASSTTGQPMTAETTMTLYGISR